MHRWYALHGGVPSGTDYRPVGGRRFRLAAMCGLYNFAILALCPCDASSWTTALRCCRRSERSSNARASPSSAWHRTGARRCGRSTSCSPDVTLVDIDLGGESGFDLVAGDRARPRRGRRRRMILISAHAEADFADLIAASPAVGFLSKSELSARGRSRRCSRANGSPGT